MADPADGPGDGSTDDATGTKTEAGDELAGRVAVVTGGSSGIGRQVCLALAREGASVVVADRRETPREGGPPTAARVEREFGVEATFVACDVADPGSFRAVIDAASAFGGVDVMVNNAGVFRAAGFLETTPEAFDEVMTVNARGVFFGAQAAARAMVDRGTNGSIVNLSSTAGLYGVGDYVAYCASKGAVRVMTYAMADALGSEGIRVNAVHPGVVESAMTREDSEVVGTARGEAFESRIPLERFGVPADVAEAVVYLASDRSGYVTGSSLVVDGGLANTV